VPGLGDDQGPNSISWQETFVSLFEGVLGYVKDCEEKEAMERLGAPRSDDGAGNAQPRDEDVESRVILPYEDLQRYMSRAIAFFLFDDVEVPSLVWLSGTEEDVYVSLPSSAQGEGDPQIIAFLPTLSHALWGDPLLESIFLSLSSPNSAVSLEGYTYSPLILFPRQRTKRLWYTIYLCLVVLGEWYLGQGSTLGGQEDARRRQEHAKCARGMIVDCVEALKDSPCY
jgi:hypothetical protein